jgi:hypothetical protein
MEEGVAHGVSLPDSRAASLAGLRSSATTVVVSMTTRRGAYPGTFNPPTVAHLAIAKAAFEQCGLDRVELIVSTSPLGKVGDPELAPIATRMQALEAVVRHHDWLAVSVTERQLLADIAEGYDVLVLGADKWAQVNDPGWYASPDARDLAVRQLPALAIAPRPPYALPQPDHGIVLLDIDPAHHDVSATAVRQGERRWLADELRQSGQT